MTVIQISDDMFTVIWLFHCIKSLFPPIWYFLKSCWKYVFQQKVLGTFSSWNFNHEPKNPVANSITPKTMLTYLVVRQMKTLWLSFIYLFILKVLLWHLQLFLGYWYNKCSTPSWADIVTFKPAYCHQMTTASVLPWRRVIGVMVRVMF